jgi:ATP phosphoribosyltransferase regulatory subunit HisZ
MLIFDFLAINADLRIKAEPTLRLRDVIGGLKSGDIRAAALLDRLDPNLSDEIRAVAAHRGVSAESFLANVLKTFALDAADEALRQLVQRSEVISDDAEADALGNLFAEALRRTLVQDVRLGARRRGSEPARTLGRRVSSSSR